MAWSRVGGRRAAAGWRRSVVRRAWWSCLWLAIAVPAAAQAPPSPATLQEAIRYAMENHPSVRASTARVSAGESGVALARTAYLPRLDSAFQINRATRNNVPGLLLPGSSLPSISGPATDLASSSSIWGSAGGVLLSWEAFDFGLRGASVEVARTQVTRARAEATLTRLEVGVASADAFLRLAAAEETVRAARANVERQQVFTDAVGVLVQNDLRPGADGSRAQAELALARIQLIQAEQEEQIARAELAQWLGVPSTEIAIAAAPLLDGPPPLPAAAAPPAAHPLAETQMAAVASARARQAVIGRSYVPRIGVQGAVSVRGTGATANGANLGGARGLEPDTPNWGVGLTATFPLFDWFALRERARIEGHVARAESDTYDRVLRELSARSERARAEIDGARRVAENTPIQLASARVLEQQSRARYDAGLGTIMEVADSQRLLLQAEVGDAVARLAIWRALIADAAARGDLSALLP